MSKITNVKRAIERRKEKLIKKAKENGLYENFGQDEVRELEGRYIDSSSYTDEMNKIRDLIHEFDCWAMYYNGD